MSFLCEFAYIGTRISPPTLSKEDLLDERRGGAQKKWNKKEYTSFIYGCNIYEVEFRTKRDTRTRWRVYENDPPVGLILRILVYI